MANLAIPALCAAAAAALAVTSAGCQELECGLGTVERDGVCQPPTATPDPTRCGAGTQLMGGECVPILEPTMCDPDTTEAVVDPETGITICLGTGGGGCGSLLPGCDMAANGTMTVCGRIYDVENDAEIGGGTDTSECPAGGEATGACSLVLTPYDALGFAADPTGAEPLTTAQTYLDHCGRYKLRDIQPAGAPFIGLGVDNHPSQPDSYKLTGVAFPTETNVAKANVVAYATRNATDVAWTTGTGEGTSLAAQGVYINIYRDHGTGSDPFSGEPAQGVQILRGGSPITNDDYYFEDATAGVRSMVAPTSQTTTGINGAVLVLRQPSLAPYTGTMGPLPGGCGWYQSTGATIAGVVFAQIHPPSPASCTF